MAGKWKRQAKEQARTIADLRQQIEGQRAYERTLRQMLEIAKKDAADARRWAEQAEAAMPITTIPSTDDA
jgi:hypothetical protein